jgi:hypothetical protein
MRSLAELALAEIVVIEFIFRQIESIGRFRLFPGFFGRFLTGCLFRATRARFADADFAIAKRAKVAEHFRHLVKERASKREGASPKNLLAIAPMEWKFSA